jgi:prolyl-tRNA editing enzyme YbaK/EbsC (Cys-tRNA(Pro) deacylase)
MSSIKAKALLVRCRHTERFAIAVCANADKVDLSSVALQCGWKKARLASRREFTQLFGARIDTITMLQRAALPVVIDTPLLQCARVQLGTGRSDEYIEMPPRYLQCLTRAITAPVALSRARWE